MNQNKINKLLEYIKIKYGAYIIIDSLRNCFILELPNKLFENLSSDYSYSFVSPHNFIYTKNPSIFWEDPSDINNKKYYDLIKDGTLISLKELSYKKVKIYIDILLDAYIKEYNEIIKNNIKTRKDYYLRMLEQL